MANPEHLAILKQGVEAWNKWRRDNLRVSPDLRGANLECFGPQRNNLQSIDLGGADLRESNLSRSDLQRSNLQLANLQNAKLGGVDLRDAYLSSANLQGTALPLANLQGAALWRADLQGADLAFVNLQGASPVDANLQDANLGHANLQCSDLWNADLRGADLRHADLRGSNLQSANLTGLDLRDAENLDGIYLYRTIMDGMQLPREKLGRGLGEEISKSWGQAQEAYLSLKNLWQQQGRYNDAAWAYRKERRMEKKAALKRAVEARQARNWGEATKDYAKVVSDVAQELICDYGESIWRVLASLVVVWLLFTVIYGAFALVLGPWQETLLADGGIARTRTTTRNVLQLLAYSLGTMTAMEPAGLEGYPCLAMQILAPVQSFLGIGLAGLLGFVLGNRIRRS